MTLFLSARVASVTSLSLFFFEAEDRTQGLAFARQALYPNPCYFSLIPLRHTVISTVEELAIRS